MARKRFWRPCVGLLAGLGLTLAACGPAVTEGTSPLATPSAGEPSAGGVTIPGAAQPIADLVIQDAAEQSNVDPGAVQIVSIEAVDWPDSSLGCPQPGIVYAQVLTPGFVIVVEASSHRYTYHTGPDGFVRCDQPDMQPTAKARPGSAAATLVAQAQNDLSTRLDIPPEEIAVRSVEPVDWPDSSLGCPQPGMNYLTVVTPGYRIELEAASQTYEYHTGEQRVVYCQNAQPSSEGEAAIQAAAAQQAIDAATSDLARQLDLAPEEIRLVTVEAVQWPDASLGCPEPGMSYVQMIVPGYRIVLMATGQEYEYHADLTRAISCHEPSIH
jgi:hypothetical protein